MKKKLALVFATLALMVLAGCGKEGISAKDAGSLFANELVFHTKTEQFENEFVDGKNLAKALNLATTNISTNFFKDFSTGEGTVDEATTKELTAQLLSQTDKQAKYVTVVKKDSKKNAIISYQVYGLDYVSMMKLTTQNVMNALLKDRKLATDQKRVTDLTVKEIKQNLEETEMKPQVVETDLTFGQQDGKWYIKDGQEDKIRNLYLSFVTGEKNQAALDAEMKKSVDAVAKKVQAQLDKEATK
jgi:uncharacterized protein YcfL